MGSLSRRRFVASLSSLGLTSVPFARSLWAQTRQAPTGTVTIAMVREAASVAGLTYSDAELQGMLGSLNRILARAVDLHRTPPENDAPSPTPFNPRVPGIPVSVPARIHRPSTPNRQTRPAALEDVAFRSVLELSDLLHRRAITSLELTELYLDRLDRFNRVLNCVVTLTRERALAEARAADRELAAGHSRGPLHGMP